MKRFTVQSADAGLDRTLREHFIGVREVSKSDVSDFTVVRHKSSQFISLSCREGEKNISRALARVGGPSGFCKKIGTHCVKHERGVCLGADSKEKNIGSFFNWVLVYSTNHHFCQKKLLF